ncbi:MAG TPA: fructosamine kinase family protein [Woeseiaceae bacterium]|nr:fructosamine kinase family protein [Woeseiaceae bacterium]
MPDWAAILEALAQQGIAVKAAPAPRALGGGDISTTWRLSTENGPVFLKTGDAAAFEQLDAEADGLRELQDAAAVRVPRVLCAGRGGADSFLALEWLDFQSAGTGAARVFGQQLAAQHRHTQQTFGWHRDNTIGSTPQRNTPDRDWIRFFREQRLVFQLELAARNGFTGELQSEGAALARRLGGLFDGYSPQPSLLHGDLWGGNWAVVDGEPVIFDPAVHYGDRECDLAMTRLFGGFPPGFYAAYEEAWPLAPGHRGRLPLYQLYHVLNHLNLFGRSYLGRALSLLRELNASA